MIDEDQINIVELNNKILIKEALKRNISILGTNDEIQEELLKHLQINNNNNKTSDN